MDLVSFFLKLLTVVVLVVVVGPTAIFTMFPSVSPWALGSGYFVVVLAAIAVLTGAFPDMDNTVVQVGLTALAFTVVGPMMLLTAFPSTNRFVLIVSYLFVLGFVLENWRRRHNRKSREEASERFQNVKTNDEAS